MDAESEDTQFRRSLAKGQTGVEITLRASSALAKEGWCNHQEECLCLKASHRRRPQQGNNWDQCGDSSSAASASASAEESGKGTYSMSEKFSRWGPWLPESSSNKQVQSAQPYRFQPANRGASSWADWARKVRDSQPKYQASSSNRGHASAGGAHAWERTWKNYSSDGVDQSGLL